MKSINSRQARRLAAAVLALSLAFGSPAFAAAAETKSNISTGSSVSSQRFTDVGDQHWAIKHVTKLASLGVIEGYEKGEYKPENSVSQQEVIVMALRFMGLESEVAKNKTETALPFSVDKFFKPYVAYAIDRGLINIQEETADGTNAKTAWGAKEASREWVAKLVIRAIGKQELATQQAQSSSSFTDSKDFSSWAAGYINAAVSLKIVQGFEDNSFKPKDKVTRAQMATFLSRADKESTSRSSRVATGYVMELTDRKISVLNANGQTTEYTLSSDTAFYSGKDDSRISPSNIKLTNEVYLVQNQGAALYIELTNDQQKMETYEGTLTEIFTDRMMASIQRNGKNELYDLFPTVTVTDKDGRGLSLSSLTPGSIVELKKNTLLKESKISQIVLKQTPVSKTSEGTVLTLNKDQNQVTFLEQGTGQNESFTLTTRTVVKLQDGSTADLSKLRVGDAVSYEVKANELQVVSVKKPADFSQSVEGTMASLSSDKRILTINKAGGSLGAYHIADNAIITIDGLTNPSLFDIESGDQLKMDLINDKIVKISVTSRSVKQYIYATILSYDANSKVVTISTESDGVGAYRLTDNTIIRFMGGPIQLSNFQSTFVGNGNDKKKVDLKVSKDKIVQIETTMNVEGTIAQINTSNITNDLTIRTAGGQNLTFKVNYGAPVEMFNKTNGTISDLKVGDAIRLTLTGTQDFVTNLMAKKTGVYKVLVTNPSTSQVTVKDETGSQLTFKVENNDQIINPGKQSHAFSDILVDEYVKASFSGTKLDNLQLLNSVRGKVTNVDVAAGTLTIQDFQGNIQVITVGQQFTIRQNANTSAALNTIKQNDRVEIIRDANDKAIIQVATATKRTVSSYDTVLNQLLLKPTANNDKTSYNLFAKAYLHKGTQTVAPSTFMENEEVMVYVIDDKIFEIEKP
ncbi:S-layer homology domain-containing protein [Paenibacillus ehimensis]|uniref:S-layer homology domain-containing protein n=1 Tax=Paenibacillus ehimensis TaxID=79264 RepID=A0ABT8VDS7_9BACL|nr:S-layer homology domain-containing protein [Paenibacillus ehimensis]MDO3679120.1 S-layer homology domain-containing protein [Paenibacillus ehimensis]MEC0207689.1 S-layer homology domain-containing protein [Paenibacillus ehimensis]